MLSNLGDCDSMLFASQTWLTDQIHALCRLDHNSGAKLSLEQLVHILNVEMSKPTMLQSLIQRTCRHQTRKVGHGLHSAIDMSHILGVNGCSKQKLGIANERNVSRINGNIVGLVSS